MFVSRNAQEAVMGGSVKFKGRGPFYLRAVERAHASALENTVQVTLFARVEERGQSLVQIETQMTPSAAEDLANTLLRAANKTTEGVAG
jgi:hypothetical protein